MSRFGLSIPKGWRQDLPLNLQPREHYDMIRSFALEAEKIGFDSGWLNDHLHSSPEPKPTPIFECWSTLSALAVETESLRLGTLVTCNSYRNPALLAKMSSTMDVISNGRLEFGIGAGWLEAEYHAYGFPFPKGSKRIEQMEEAIQIIKMMWTQEKTSFQGKNYTVKEAFNEPKPIQKPHPPILIGGGGELRTLQTVAKYADRCNFYASPEGYQRKLELLKTYCSNLGRSFEKLDKTVSLWLLRARDEASAREEVKRLMDARSTLESILACSLWRGPREWTRRLEEYLSIGATYFMLQLPDSGNFDKVRLFAKEVIPSFL